MRNLKFKYIGAWNFLCFGPEGIELHLEQLGSILVVKGENWHDINPLTGKPGSNGTGKSCLQDIISYALFGRVTRESVKHGDVIHKKDKKKCRVEVIWDKYRVVRTRKPDSLRIWESEEGIWDESTEVTPGAGTTECQKKIEAILGMNYKSFVGVTVFDDRNDHSILEADAATKREIIENILSLEVYREYNKAAKAVKANAEKVIRDMLIEYNRSQVELELANKRVEQIKSQRSTWKISQQDKINVLLREVLSLDGKLKQSGAGAALDHYNHAQSRIAELMDQIATDESNRHKVAKMVDHLKEQQDTLRLSMHKAKLARDKAANNVVDLQHRMMSLTDQIVALENLQPGILCDKCFGEIKKENTEHVLIQCRIDLEKLGDTIKQAQSVVEDQDTEVTEIARDFRAKENTLKFAHDKDKEILLRISEARAELTQLQKVVKPELDRDTAVLEARIADLKQQIKLRETELEAPSPYDQILDDAVSDVDRKKEIVESGKNSIADAENLIPYFKFWVDAFGDDGIRRYVIDGIIPSLNEQIAYWLNILIYGNIKLTFDNMLEPTIERVPFDNDPFVYSITSGGERRRMNWSVMNGLAYVQMLSCGACPSILFLDEVVTNIDTNGKQAAYDMIQELAQTRQIFLTTHDAELLDMLEGCQVIQLERRDGITKMVSKTV